MFPGLIFSFGSYSLKTDRLQLGSGLLVKIFFRLVIFEPLTETAPEPPELAPPEAVLAITGCEAAPTGETVTAADSEASRAVVGWPPADVPGAAPAEPWPEAAEALIGEPAPLSAEVPLPSAAVESPPNADPAAATAAEPPVAPPVKEPLRRPPGEPAADKADEPPEPAPSAPPDRSSFSALAILPILRSRPRIVLGLLTASLLAAIKFLPAWPNRLKPDAPW
jgi:hypothetical protein